MSGAKDEKTMKDIVLEIDGQIMYVVKSLWLLKNTYTFELWAYNTVKLLHIFASNKKNQ